ncbi:MULTISPECIES: hypothetical protein [Sphingopyxis]|uniref:hypothetical protein n=1 Tax=Sphingopyxis TaxID=165697 RepID=UPI001C2C6236|nr:MULTISPECIES: hypothetical protein [Sphingopyxis]QXF12260.1 hypothetical protein HBA51_08935 [Sphingopyxis terrae subsp. terrae]
MRHYQLVLLEGGEADPRRIEFRADDPYQAFQAALNERGSSEVELWDGEKLLVRMSKTEANLWKLHGAAPDSANAPPSFHPPTAAG